jgi:copper oxidase (laccase) domain-containing protein
MTTHVEVLTEVAVVEMAEAEALEEVVGVVVVVAMLDQIHTTSLSMTRAVADMMAHMTKVAVEPADSLWTTKTQAVCMSSGID